MRNLVVGLFCLGLLAGLAAAQYHDPVFLWGGHGSTSSMYANGLFIGDVQNQKITSLMPGLRSYYIYCARMDADNRNVVFVANKTTSSSYQIKSGIFRLDPSTLSITTILATNTQTVYYPYRLMINQDGDYVFGCQERRLVGSRYYYYYNILKFDAGSTLTTLLTTLQVGERAYFQYSIGKNIDTGNYLIDCYSYSTTLRKNWRYPVLELDANTPGKWTTFSNGGGYYGYGWYGYYDQLQQNFSNGAIEGKNYTYLYQLKPGTTSRTTLYVTGYPGGWSLQSPTVFDLQSAPKKQHVQGAYRYGRITSPTTFYFYRPGVMFTEGQAPFFTTASLYDPNMTPTPYPRYYYTYTLDFYRGRHIQTVKTGTGKWTLLLSCPSHPKKGYVAAVSLTGVRPGITLGDGRTIWLAPDIFTQLSILGALKPFFDGGPGVLDSKGEARGSLDFSSLPPLGGLPVWIALAVVDAKAPSGIAYLPDTYVMRLP